MTLKQTQSILEIDITNKKRSKKTINVEDQLQFTSGYSVGGAIFRHLTLPHHFLDLSKIGKSVLSLHILHLQFHMWKAREDGQKFGDQRLILSNISQTIHMQLAIPVPSLTSRPPAKQSPPLEWKSPAGKKNCTRWLSPRSSYRTPTARRKSHIASHPQLYIRIQNEFRSGGATPISIMSSPFHLHTRDRQSSPTTGSLKAVSPNMSRTLCRKMDFEYTPPYWKGTVTKPMTVEKEMVTNHDS